MWTPMAPSQAMRMSSRASKLAGGTSLKSGSARTSSTASSGERMSGKTGTQAHTALVSSDIKHLIHGYTNLAQHRSAGPRIFARGEGIYVIDTDGRRYIEAAAGMWCASLGFS